MYFIVFLTIAMPADDIFAAQQNLGEHSNFPSYVGLEAKELGRRKRERPAGQTPRK